MTFVRVPLPVVSPVPRAQRLLPLNFLLPFPGQRPISWPGRVLRGGQVSVSCPAFVFLFLLDRALSCAFTLVLSGRRSA